MKRLKFLDLILSALIEYRNRLVKNKGYHVCAMCGSKTSDYNNRAKFSPIGKDNTFYMECGNCKHISHWFADMVDHRFQDPNLDQYKASQKQLKDKINWERKCN